MELKSVVKSQVDKTVKYIWKKNQEIVEYSWIDKDDGKHIICVPSQTTCNLGCSFCYLTGDGAKVVQITATDTLNAIENICPIDDTTPRDNTLLISFMGAGEALLNVEECIETMLVIRDRYQYAYETVRFAIATIMFNEDSIARLARSARKHNIDVKLHFSLHSTNDAERRDLVPNGMNIAKSLMMLNYYQQYSNNDVEIHYTPIANVNDSAVHLQAMIKLLEYYNFPVKFLKLSSEDDSKPSMRVGLFMDELAKRGIESEYYAPPGNDIGSSCGQFKTLNSDIQELVI